MRPRRAPAGSLAALAVVLAALAVVVVAGARAPTRDGGTSTRPTSPAQTSTTVPSRHVRVRIKVEYVRVPVLSGNEGAGTSPSTRTASTTSTTIAVTTTTTRGTTTTTTTTTTAAARPRFAARSGAFTMGATKERVRLGPVHEVTVLVPAGVEVTLQVVCGLDDATRASSTTVTVLVRSGAASCTATFTVPGSTPEPARWRLVAR